MSDEVTALRKENRNLKEMVAGLMLRYNIVKKPVLFGIDEKRRKYRRLSIAKKQEIIPILV